MRNEKLDKTSCEICGYANKSALQLHHIIPRTDPNSTDFPHNLACVCANCHNLIHAKEIVIEGRFASTRQLTAELVWHHKGEKYKIREGVILNDDGTASVK